MSLSEGRARSRSPARLTSFRVRELLNVKIATSISSITVRSRAVASSAPRRCSRRVSLNAFTSSITSPRASSPRADGKIFLAHCGEKIGQSLQREDNALPEGKREAQPKNNDEDRKRPGCLRRIVAKPQQEDRDQRSREARGQPQ